MSKVLTLDSSAISAKPPVAASAAQPSILLVTTVRWYPTARLAMALRDAGCVVDAVCPSGHPFGLTQAVRTMHNYNGLRPVKK